MVDYLNLLAAALHVLVGAFVAYEILRLGRRAPRTAAASSPSSSSAERRC